MAIYRKKELRKGNSGILKRERLVITERVKLSFKAKVEMQTPKPLTSQLQLPV